MLSGHAVRDIVHNGFSCMTFLFWNWFGSCVSAQVQCRYRGSVPSPRTKCPITSSKCNFRVSICIVAMYILLPWQETWLKWGGILLCLWQMDMTTVCLWSTLVTIFSTKIKSDLYLFGFHYSTQTLLKHAVCSIIQNYFCDWLALLLALSLPIYLFFFYFSYLSVLISVFVPLQQLNFQYTYKNIQCSNDTIEMFVKQ